MSTLAIDYTYIIAHLVMIIPIISAATDTINTSQMFRDGESLISSGGRFEMGFFSPGNSTNRYMGMWYRNLTETMVLWVANREAPFRTTSGVLRLTEQGLLSLSNDYDTNATIWSTTASRRVLNPVAQLLDSGNLVVREADDDRPENFIWQSLDYPGDTFIPGIKFGWNFVTGIETYLTSWKSSEDPSPGDFTMHIELDGYPQSFMRRNGVARSRVGPWNGVRFSGERDASDNPVYRLNFVMNKNEVSYQEQDIDRSIKTRVTLGPSGVGERLMWVDKQGWVVYMNMPADNCDLYNLCGANGFCSIDTSPICGCLNRFVPKDRSGWLRTDWSNGCIRRTNLSCQGDVFLKQSGIKLPDSRNSTYTENRTLEECREECLRNCSCTAYTQLDISRKGSGCLFWYGDLNDIRYIYSGGQEIYIRMVSSEIDSKGHKKAIFIASLTSGIGMVFIGVSLTLFLFKRKNYSKKEEEGVSGKVDRCTQEDTELPSFKYGTISKATDHFSDKNKLGEGGFGPVFKGTLEKGQEIAVKCLSTTSKQGLHEFKNEVLFIARLQHRNLVKLLGYCIQGDENMLIYEYMPNKSLDLTLFDQNRSVLLDWKKRFRIVNEIARGLLYLHEDSRLRIIHRDLKASNILLDSSMNPKISDFGIARSFGATDVVAKTRHVIGTYGYMSPEYAVDGLFSVKSDVFSFGVLVLEIVSGKRNSGFSDGEHYLNLLGHAWRLYKEERLIELLDASIGNSFDLSEVVRSIHVGLLCVQSKPQDRPTMSSVVLMLGNEGMLPPAKQPGFFTEREVLSQNVTNSTNNGRSTNEVTITLPEGR